jgi:hypothetical protein
MNLDANILLLVFFSASLAFVKIPFRPFQCGDFVGRLMMFARRLSSLISKSQKTKSLTRLVKSLP